MSNSLDAMTLFSKTREEVVTVTKETTQAFDVEATAYWNKCLEIIRDNVNSQVFKTWFEPLRALKYADNQLIIQVPSQFYCEWIEEHYYPLLQRTIYQIVGEKTRLQYQVVVDDKIDSLENRTIRVPAFKHASSAPNTALPFMEKKHVPDQIDTNLNRSYSFDSFIKGESNQLASSAAMAVSQSPGTTRFNPLVIYGDTGLGKTHLVQALGNAVVENNPKARVLYTNSERFTFDYVNSIQNNKYNDFINFYRSIDVLIVDDIQFFAGKEKTQDSFFHTFNALHQAGKQLVLTSDKPPRDLKDVDDRLISRFQWGLIADIQAPDYEMRLAILQRKSEDEGITLPPDVLEYFARNVKTNIREMEGTLIGLIAKVTLDRRILNLELAKEVVNGVAKLEPRQITADVIKEYVSKYFNIPIEAMESKSRKHEIALARQMCMFLAKKMTQLSLKSIGQNFGGRDHSTVLHSCQMIENYLVTDKNVKNACELLLAKLKLER